MDLGAVRLVERRLRGGDQRAAANLAFILKRKKEKQKKRRGCREGKEENEEKREEKWKM